LVIGYSFIPAKGTDGQPLKECLRKAGPSLKWIDKDENRESG